MKCFHLNDQFTPMQVVPTHSFATEMRFCTFPSSYVYDYYSKWPLLFTFLKNSCPDSTFFKTFQLNDQIWSINAAPNFLICGFLTNFFWGFLNITFWKFKSFWIGSIGQKAYCNFWNFTRISFSFFFFIS